eukprot:m.572783 g.572783  ORF g.572783 m.572783 type:complete len:255 (+) comp57871_c0_seq1:5349-6113(+)
MVGVHVVRPCPLIGQPQRILDAAYQATGTATGSALDLVRSNVLIPAAGYRGGRTSVVLITDGATQESEEVLQNAAARLRAIAEVFVLGVGVDIDVNELDSIATAPRSTHVFLSDFSEIYSRELSDRIDDTVRCAPPSTTTSTTLSSTSLTTSTSSTTESGSSTSSASDSATSSSSSTSSSQPSFFESVTTSTSTPAATTTAPESTSTPESTTNSTLPTSGLTTSTSSECCLFLFLFILVVRAIVQLLLRLSLRF